MTSEKSNKNVPARPRSESPATEYSDEKALREALERARNKVKPITVRETESDTTSEEALHFRLKGQ